LDVFSIVNYKNKTVALRTVDFPKKKRSLTKYTLAKNISQPQHNKSNLWMISNVKCNGEITDADGSVGTCLGERM